MNNPIKTVNGFTLFCTFMGGVILLFVIAPLANMVFATPLADLKNAATSDDVVASIWLTLWASMVATLVAAIFTIPLAYLLAREKLPATGFLNAVLNLPVVIPHSAAGIALLGILSRNTLVGGAAESAGIRFVGGEAGIVAAMAFVSLPFLANAARDGFAAVPERLEKAALSLGASRTRVFLTISLPLAWRSVLSGLVLMWARGLSEFGAVIILAYHPMIAPIMIYERFAAFGLKYARPVSVLFTVICLVIFIIMRRLSRKDNYAQR